MALNIPMPGAPGTALLNGLNTGSTLISRIMNSRLEQERLKQQQAQFLQDLALKKQAEQRSESLFPYQLQQLKDVHAKAANETLIRNYINSALNGRGAPSISSSPAMAPQSNNVMTPNGQLTAPTGATPNATDLSLPDNALSLAPSSMSPNQDMNQQEHELRPGNPRLIKLDSMAGLVPGIPKPIQNISNGMLVTSYPSGRVTAQQIGTLNGNIKETPDEKRQKDMEAKLEFDKKQAENKEQQAAAADIPHLQATKQGLQVMEQIASDPKNENLFGHWIEGHDLAAKRSSNPNAGTWQTYGLNPIINAEMKMSSRGNQLALKTALANKPNFAENRQVALAKIKASIKQIDDQIKQSQSKLPKTTGKFDHLSDEQLQAIVEGK